MEKQHSDLVLLYIVPSHWKLIMSGLFPRDVLLIQGAVGIGREPCMGNNKILTELPRRYIFNISQATLSLTRDAQLHVISATEYKQLVYSYFMCNVPCSGRTIRYLIVVIQLHQRKTEKINEQESYLHAYVLQRNISRWGMVYRWRWQDLQEGSCLAHNRVLRTFVVQREGMQSQIVNVTSDDMFRGCRQGLRYAQLTEAAAVALAA